MPNQITTIEAVPQRNVYSTARVYIINAQRQLYSAINSAMVSAYLEYRQTDL